MSAPLAHQASCVAIGGRGLLIEGPPGSGKSSLALALIDRGAVLVGDDGVLLEAAGGRLLASPHPAIAGKLEVRSLGLIDVPVAAAVPLALVVRLGAEPPRFRDRADTCVLHGVTLPLVPLSAASPVLALVAELALAHYGIQPERCDFHRDRSRRTKPVMSDESHPPTQRILLVTGLLGAGKTTALRVLEDLGWEAIDNFPVRLLDRLLATAPNAAAGASDETPPAPLAIGFDSRTRGFNPRAIIGQVGEFAARRGVDVTTLFLDCSDAELERRYNETRRRHPLALDKPLALGIAAERELLEPLRSWADAIISTTDFTVNRLQQAIRERFAPLSQQGTTITVSSFGFARGTPPLSDLVFDVRFLDNPHWVDALRPLTGQDDAVAAHIRADPAWNEAFARIRDLLLLLLPRFAAQGKAYVNIAFGCTGGRHRSVFFAEEIGRALRAAGFAPTLLHRNLASRAVDQLEDAQTS